MSLANRIALLVIGLLGVGALLAGFAFHQAVRRALVAELDGRMDARLGWLEGVLEVDRQEVELEADEGPEPSDAAEHWQVKTPAGRVLWASRMSFRKPYLVTRSRTLRFRAYDESVADAWSEYPLTAEPEPDARPYGARAYLRPAGEKGAELVLVAGTSSSGMRDELNRLTRALWTVGPLAILGCGGLLVLGIRRQLRPLERMAAQASRIGPDNLAARVSSVGTATECVALRDAINALVERLAEGLERERQFASSAAHELRTPVAQLRTQIEVALRQERSVASYQESLGHALADVDRLQELVAGLLHLTRSGELAATAEHPVSIAEVLESVATRTACEWISPPATGAGLWVEGEQELICAALQNLLSNAQRYAPGRPPSITVEVEANHVLLIVGDHGPGIPEADREHIFEPLTRLDASRSIGDAADGFGLGLTIARTSMRAFGGDLICRDRGDEVHGSEFVMSLRRAAPT